MTLPRQGRRRVQVGDTAFFWTIRKKPTRAQALALRPMHLAVQAIAEGPTRVLIVDLGVTRPDNGITPHGTGITPALVRHMIWCALAAGWEPRGAGLPFAFEYRVIMDSVGTIARSNAPEKRDAPPARGARTAGNGPRGRTRPRV
ncbi:hypothetical protein [Chondromyces crocatus]|uniref:Uncharacterized protein n=1 Tax=Chondromyces crocatus TaxID=52 RepID=A0A0K1EAU9_CHOCO|nr:hypothetical protein [Chondromyces crocatus]AKT37995.1 uncharacterized protein CMC5_021360 [Chondromyces crocatus]